jgi:ribose-phosphate pyrophosphokinase
MKSHIYVFDRVDSGDCQPVPYDSFIFNGGEVHVRFKRKPDRIVRVEAHIVDSEGIMKLLMISDALDRQGVYIKALYLPYFPYARQDRVCVEGEALSCKVMANLINSMGFKNVTINDPHSDVIPALIDKCYVNEQAGIFFDMKRQHKCIVDLVVAPDGGAIKKAMKCAKLCGAEFATAEKVRNVDTGDIVSTKFNWDALGGLGGHHVWVVDDICDGGRTFVELAKVIRKKNPAVLNLFVTHGIFSKGVEELFEYYDTIVTTDSFLSDAVMHEDVNVYSV